MVRTMTTTISCRLAILGMIAVLDSSMAWQVAEQELFTTSTFQDEGLGELRPEGMNDG